MTNIKQKKLNNYNVIQVMNCISAVCLYYVMVIWHSLNIVAKEKLDMLDNKQRIKQDMLT